MEPKKKVPVNNKVAQIGLVYHSKIKVEDQPKIHNANCAYKVLLDNWNMDTIELNEEFAVLFLTAAKTAHGMMKVSIGSLAGTYVEPRMVFTAALKCRAHSIIVAHNHPSLYLKPSQADMNITRKLVESGRVLGIEVLDHLIITPCGYFSFSDEGLL